MRILSLTPGTGGTFYCENCLRDGQMVRALRRQRHDITVVPLYLPILLDSEGLNSDTGVFFGGVNVYLQQRLRFFQKTPRWLDRLFDSRWMLRKAAAREGSTRAADLGPMTYSMLQGKHGQQRKELDRFLTWLKDQPKPDVAHISNALLLGVAAEVRETLKCTVVCSLQDEDTWIDGMDGEWRERCWSLLAEKARDADAFIAVSDWYAARIGQRMRIPRDKMHIVPLGTDWEPREPAALPFDPPVLGYLSRIHSTQGFSALVDAFMELKQHPKLKNLRLRATGGVTSGDREYVKHELERLAARGYAHDVEIIEEFDKPSRQAFVQSLTVLSAPAPEGEAFGLFILEAGACGVPVVQPNVGAFGEVVHMTGGGVVYDPSHPKGLVSSLEQVLLNPELALELGHKGLASVRERFTSDAMARKVAAVFQTSLAANLQAENPAAISAGQKT